ncbi:MAG: xylulokinase [Burkholderiales bacterium RIFOXYD12_FULL_59_19]|nr:MAG: xylulokinase [Burkholderiales bacterium RIFOXYD12_FULL_59_19]
MYLGIDLGTSGLKLLLLDAAHHVHASADAPLTLQRPHPGWSEQHPQDWWLALEAAVAQLRALAPEAWQQVRAIGLSGQMHGAVVLNAQHEVLRPAILWNDGRADAQCTTLEQRVPNSRQITGNLAMPGFTAPKLLWLHEHEPAVFAQVSQVLLPKDWLRLQLTGESVSEMSDASGTLWLDVARRCWSEPMLVACGLTLAHMPHLVEGSQPSGTLRSALARQWGLPQHVMVAGGGGDNASSAVGIGAVNQGQGFVSLGTSGVVFLASDHYQPAPELAVHAFAHALPGRWHQMAVMLSAASAFGWVTQLTGTADEAQLSQQVAGLSLPRRAAAPVFLPYLSGERTPHNNPNASGVFVGLRSNHTAADLAYAVMEGVSFGLTDGLRAMGQSGPSAVPLTLVGGGARSDAWAQLLASALGCPLLRCEGAHTAAALGAARLAWLADGGKLRQVCQNLPTERAFEPDASGAQLLHERYPRYRALYPALINLF